MVVTWLIEAFLCSVKSRLIVVVVVVVVMVFFLCFLFRHFTTLNILRDTKAFHNYMLEECSSINAVLYFVLFVVLTSVSDLLVCECASEQVSA